MSSKTINEIHNRILRAIPNEYNKTEGYPMYDLSRGFAFALKELADEIEQVKEKQSVRNLTGDELTQVVEERTGLTRKVAVKSLVEIKVLAGARSGIKD